MRQSWTDDRLDEFRHRVDERFDQVDRRFEQVDRRFDRVDDEIKALRAEVVESSHEWRAEFAAYHRTLMQVGGGIIAALIAVLVTQL